MATYSSGEYLRLRSEQWTFPVSYVSWDFARLWLALPGLQLRLPSEAEWEYACRAGTDTTFFFGSTQTRLHEYAPLRRDTEQGSVLSAANFAFNAFGLYDIVGKTYEMTADQWANNYRHVRTPKDGSAFNFGARANEQDPDIEAVLRGFPISSTMESWYGRSAFRTWWRTFEPLFSVSFRPAATVEWAE